MNFWSLERVKREDPAWWTAMVEIHEQPVEKLLQWWADEDAERPNFSPADLAHVRVPTLVMGGDRDPIIPLQQSVVYMRRESDDVERDN